MKGVRIIIPCVCLLCTSVPHLSLGAESQLSLRGAWSLRAGLACQPLSDAPQKFQARGAPNEH